MAKLYVDTIEPEGATTTLTLGASGDTVTSSADSIKVNTFKDAGGNTLFTSDGAGTLSSVNSAIAGSMIFISSQTASASSSISFTSRTLPISRCPLLLTGKNSVSPCMTPRINASIQVMNYSPLAESLFGL